MLAGASDAGSETVTRAWASEVPLATPSTDRVMARERERDRESQHIRGSHWSAQGLLCVSVGGRRCLPGLSIVHRSPLRGKTLWIFCFAFFFPANNPTRTDTIWGVPDQVQVH